VLRYAPGGDLTKVTDADIARAARDTIPEVWIVFWSFRIMVGLGLLMLAYLVLATLMTLANEVERRRWFLWADVLMVPAPFLACEFGWLVAEVGRQPWTVNEMLPTWLSASTHSVAYMVFSLSGFILLYTVFAIVEIYLMLHFIRKGPDEHAPAAGAHASPAH
jgi:cytochrome bd ubiquinol oxidase subunit I